MKPREVLVAAGAGAGIAVLAMNLVGNPFYAHESDKIKAEQNKIEMFTSDYSTNLGALVTSHEIDLDATLTVGFHVKGTPWDMKVHSTDPYHGTFVTDANFSMKGATQIWTSRKNIDSLPLPEDRIVAQVDRSAVFFNRGRNNFSSAEDNSYTVKDGFITKRNGIEVTEPERIFARNGNYKPPKTHMRGSPGLVSRLVNKGSLDNIRNGENAYDYMATDGQVEAQNPSCIDAAFKAVNFDSYATTSVTDALAKQGFAKRNIKVDFVGKLPASNKIKDEIGMTYDQHIKELENLVPGDQKIRSANTCLVGNLKDTTKPEKVMPKHTNSPNSLQASATHPNNNRPTLPKGPRPRVQHRASR